MQAALNKQAVAILSANNLLVSHLLTKVADQNHQIAQNE